MKRTLSILLALVFLFPLGALPASAQAAARPTSMAYLSLISPKSEASLPVKVQAHSAFEKLLPRLAQAQAEGQIMAFKPEYAFGMVKVQYPSGTDLAAALRLGGAAPAIFDTPAAALEYSQVGERMASDSATYTTPYVNLNLYESCFNAYYMYANGWYMAYLWDATGREVSNAFGYADGSGNFNSCFEGIWRDVDPGFHFTLNMYDHAGTTPEGTYDTIVPNMTFSSFTSASKTLKGKGPASTALTAQLWHRNLDSGEGWTFTNKAVTSASNGSWSVNFAPAAVRGYDYAYVDWSDGGDFNYQYHAYVPALNCEESYNECEVYGLPGKKASISVKHGSLSAKISGTISPWGYFWGYLYDKYGAPLFPAAGNKVSASGVKTYILPSLSSLPDYTNDAVVGYAPPNTWFQVELDVYDYPSDTWNSASDWVSSNAAGYYSANFSGSFDIVPGNRLMTEMWYYDPVTGNETYYPTYVQP